MAAALSAAGLTAIALCACGDSATRRAAPTATATATATATPTATPTATAAPTATPTATPIAELFPWERRAKAGPPPQDKWDDGTQWKGTLAEQNELMFEQLAYAHGLSDGQLEAVKAIFAKSDVIGQGNPAIARHPVSPQACQKKLSEQHIDYDNREFQRKCGSRYMAPLYDPEKGETIADAKVCIDQFEFPDVPCVYPVTWVRANEAAEICDALGKRLCDAHEWEGACYGELEPPDYEFKLFKIMKEEDARKIMQGRHNLAAEKTKRWAYGPEYRKGICATSSHKSKSCGVGWRNCGSNTFPAGDFPSCVSPLGVYDLHGNAAEHMNLPFAPEQMANVPKEQRIYGHTEMKGSWFVFDDIRAHEDHCRWRAPYWHGTKIMNPNSHRNYHLGFRCCKTVD